MNHAEQKNLTDGIYQILTLSCAGVHFILLSFFLSQSIISMVTFNIFSILCYLLLHISIKKGNYYRITMVAYIEVVIHSLLSVFILGWESGFAYYIINSFVSFGMLFFILIILMTFLYKENLNLLKQNETLRFWAEHDELTQLMNRRCIEKHLNQALEQKNMCGVNFAIALCDIDNFKLVNDRYSHECGDYVLRLVADIITKNTRQCDYVCRWGGEEILLLLNGVDEHLALNIMKRIHHEIEICEMEFRGQKISVTMTSGIVMSSEVETIQHMISKADKNMYKGKQIGKNCIIYES